LALNLTSVRELSELDERRLEWILSLAHRSLAVDSEGEMVAFALAIAPGTPYDSQNYRWFDARFERFLYLDRIAVAGPQRRRGIGTRLYDAMEAATGPFDRIVCDVNVVPPNHASLAFTSPADTLRSAAWHTDGKRSWRCWARSYSQPSATAVR
jgi:uncharacterized protein